MSYGRYLRELLAPLRLYDLEAPFNGGELNVLSLIHISEPTRRS